MNQRALSLEGHSLHKAPAGKEDAELFNPGLKISEILRNGDLVDKFKCGNKNFIAN